MFLTLSSQLNLTIRLSITGSYRLLTLYPHLVSSPSSHLCPHDLYHHFFFYPSPCPHPLSSLFHHLLASLSVFNVCPHNFSSPPVSKILPLSFIVAPLCMFTMFPPFFLTLCLHRMSSPYIFTVFTITSFFISHCVPPLFFFNAYIHRMSSRYFLTVLTITSSFIPQRVPALCLHLVFTLRSHCMSSSYISPSLP